MSQEQDDQQVMSQADSAKISISSGKAEEDLDDSQTPEGSVASSKSHSVESTWQADEEANIASLYAGKEVLARITISFDDLKVKQLKQILTL